MGLHRASTIALAAIFITCLGQLSHAQQSSNEALAANPTDEPYGWNDAKRADASELLAVYNNDLKQIDAVADAAIYAVLAAAAYRGDEGSTTDLENLAMSKGFAVSRQAQAERLIVGDLTATLFLHPDGRAILSFRGSTSVAGDWITNFDSLSNHPLLKGQVRDAVAMATSLQEFYPNIEFTGHSLGGRLAQVAALNTGRPAYAFNSAPLSRKEMADYAVLSLKGVDIRRFRTPQDIVSTLTAPTDIRIENYVEADAIDLSRVGYAHGMYLMALSMLRVNTARDEGWVSQVLEEQAAARLSGITDKGLIAQVGEIYGMELDAATTTQSSTPMFASSSGNELAGTWQGFTSAGSMQIDLKIVVAVSSPVTVSAEISLKLPSDAQWSSYQATGLIFGQTLRLDGNQWVGKHNQQFCLAAYNMTLSETGNKPTLAGSWGPLQDHPNGCPKGASGSVKLAKQP